MLARWLVLDGPQPHQGTASRHPLRLVPTPLKNPRHFCTCHWRGSGTSRGRGGLRRGRTRRRRGEGGAHGRQTDQPTARRAVVAASHLMRCGQGQTGSRAKPGSHQKAGPQDGSAPPPVVPAPGRPNVRFNNYEKKRYGGEEGTSSGMSQSLSLPPMAVYRLIHYRECSPLSLS